MYSLIALIFSSLSVPFWDTLHWRAHKSIPISQIHTHINRKYMTDMTFTEYLKREGYSKTNIKSYNDTKSKFIDWCSRKNYHSDTMDYKHCLEYVKKLQEVRGGKRVSQSTVKHKVGALKIYFNYLVDQELRFDNPIPNATCRMTLKTFRRSLRAYILFHKVINSSKGVGFIDV